MTEPKKEGYLDNRSFVDELIYCQDQGEVSDRLAKMFMLLAEKVTLHRFFVRYPFRDELVSEGIVACVDKYHKFDRNRIPEGKELPNAHAYFTSICFNQIRQFLKKEYRQKNICDELKVDMEMDPSYGFRDTFEEDKRRDEEQQQSGDDFDE